MSQFSPQPRVSGAPTAGMVCTRVSPGGETMIHVTGALTAANRRDLQQLVLAALERGERTVLVDLSETGYVDTAALGTLVMLAKRLLASGSELRLANVNQDLQVVLHLTRLDTVLHLIKPEPSPVLPPAA